jgi:hypothetical protein
MLVLAAFPLTLAAAAQRRRLGAVPEEKAD